MKAMMRRAGRRPSFNDKPISASKSSPSKRALSDKKRRKGRPTSLLLPLCFMFAMMFGYYGLVVLWDLSRHDTGSRMDLYRPPVSLIQAESTVVTAYFEIRSKYTREHYTGWMSTMLALEDPMVIFTSPSMVSTMYDLRAHALNRTLVVPMELEDLPLANDYSLDTWKKEYDKDPERRRHAGYHVFWIWLSKTFFLKSAIQKNPFGSKYFMWSDIGCFRTKRDLRWKGQHMMAHSAQVIPSRRMLFMAHHDPNPPLTLWWTAKKKEPQYFYHSGTMMAGEADTILQFHQEFLKTLKGFFERGLFVGDDQTVLQCTCLQNPDHCAYVPSKQVKNDNHYFGLRTVLARGGNFDYWFPPQLDGSQAQPAPILADPPMEERKLAVQKSSFESLLTADPPYTESQIHKLASSLATSPNTVVTGYFRLPSKFPAENYLKWMEHMLSLQDAMVIFTSADMLDRMRDLRQHATNRTVIIQMELDDLPIGTLKSTEFWVHQLDIDREKSIHQSYQLFWIWLSKTWFVTQAIQHNFFQSDLFMWSDIGCFRNKRYRDKTMILHREQVPPNAMIQMAHHKPNPPPELYYNNKYTQNQHFFHSGSQMAGYKTTWTQFHPYFLQTLDGFVERDMFIGEDQTVLQSTCHLHPTICAYLPFTELNKADNHYFGLRYALHFGGEYELYHPPPLGPQTVKL